MPSPAASAHRSLAHADRRQGGASSLLNHGLRSRLFDVSYSEARAQLSAMDCEILHCEWERPTRTRERLDDHVLWMSLSTRPARTSLQLTPLNGHACTTGSVNFLPAGQVLLAQSDGGPQQLLLCRIKPARLEALLGQQLEFGVAELVAGLDVRDRDIRCTLMRMAREMRVPGLASQGLLEALATSLLIDLGRHLQMRRVVEQREAGSLAPWQLKRICDRAESDAPPRLADMAELCGISVRQLIRAFKATTGETVHAYLEAARIARACSLLAGTDLPLKAIAIQLGFHHAANFSVAFRRSTQEAPSAYRLRVRAHGSTPRNESRRAQGMADEARPASAASSVSQAGA
ncbi:MAG: hypothetical protein JWQ90_3082 [Hydrocarboniphaga sp.]|uniref:helix-turn-helix domain-containing protein n=1 Tax=Hydrocarboniphaga sp. TaxID=2033016 RepID=UPI002604BE42|nr:helix-turn-helix transcriptional regulator [Hydrocarboniphaga sp.]MDB5970632.1 hypothetical protein [Hydrocarboniphaga sp.]